MLRFPNPGSHIESFIKIYKELFDALQNKSYFTLDDISKTLIERNLVTSSGFMGEEALSRSTREDRSRDPLYNQSKMYAELFRMLGWFQSLSNSSLSYRMTYLGAHIVSAYHDIKPLFRESILGIAFPNNVLDNKGSYILRPFATILLTMKDLDNILCRDEMIIGPLSLVNDRNKTDYLSMIKHLKSIRGDFSKLQSAIKVASKKRGISVNTMWNYTRFPLAVLEWSGWTQKERNSDIYNTPAIFHRLTPLGENQAEGIEACTDLRASDFKKLEKEDRIKLARFCFFDMLMRSGFDLSPLNAELSETIRTILPILFKQQKTYQFIFSPFQEFNLEENEEIFPETKLTPSKQLNNNLVQPQAKASSKASTSLFVDILLENKTKPISLQKKDREIADDLIDCYLKNHKDIDKCIDALENIYKHANKDKFYPLVTALFCLLGYNCEHSRAGVNYQRWDAMIIDKDESIPIEIKSPGEEQNISVKAVRQAVENKVILLSRKAYATKVGTTSFVVGFYMPNDRSEVSLLLEDIKKTFGINIGIIDFASLLRLCYEALINNKYPKTKDMTNLYGFIKA
ncbi:MAG: hypothetical protein PHS46_06815 [Candidatus Omnitrophica bacterium]|nr:hypothetical protein [Candidatus Omnitrophota bacterium]